MTDSPESTPTPDVDDSSGTSTVIWGAAAVLIVVVLLAALQFMGESKKQPEGRSALVPPNKLELKDYRVLAHSGEEMNTRDVLEKGFTVVNFMFTNCPTTCPPLSQALQKLQEAIGEMDDVSIMSFTVDPRRDDVEALSTYADRLGADPEKWKFIFTNEPTVHDIAFEGFGVGHKTEVIAHSNKFILVDRKGKARGFYAPLKEEDWLKVLLGDIDRLRAEDAVAAD